MIERDSCSCTLQWPSPPLQRGTSEEQKTMTEHRLTVSVFISLFLHAQLPVSWDPVGTSSLWEKHVLELYLLLIAIEDSASLSVPPFPEAEAVHSSTGPQAKEML